MRQRTFNRKIQATGIGVHTGEKVYLSLLPAPPDTGIRFVRTDLAHPIELPAHPDFVGDTSFSTTLSRGTARVATVEHLMAAMAGLGIDNAYVEVTAPEVPIMDGSSGTFVFLGQAAGIVEQSAPKRFIKIKKKLEIVDEGRSVSLEPYDGFSISFSIQFDHPIFHNGRQDKQINFSEESFVKEISRARTFGFLSQYEMLRAHNLARGAGMDNTVILDDYRVVNEDGLRYQDEFVRHKILDAVGDLYLLGSPVIGLFKGFKSGHALNNLLLGALLADPSSYEIVTFEEGLTDRQILLLGLPPVYALA